MHRSVRTTNLGLLQACSQRGLHLLCTQFVHPRLRTIALAMLRSDHRPLLSSYHTQWFQGNRYPFASWWLFEDDQSKSCGCKCNVCHRRGILERPKATIRLWHAPLQCKLKGIEQPWVLSYSLDHSSEQISRAWRRHCPHTGVRCSCPYSRSMVYEASGTLPRNRERASEFHHLR